MVCENRSSKNLSHTLAYSLIALQEMNLAYKYPIIFWDCANLIVDSGGDETIEDEKNTNYEKIAAALGKIISGTDTKISLIDINKSGYTFEPDVENNKIVYGFKALSGVNSETIDIIISNRPYVSIIDFLNRVNLKKSAMISLIKAGAFDFIDESWAKEVCPENPRKAILGYYLASTAKLKTKLTLTNFNGLIQNGLIPKELDFEKRVYYFNKYLSDKKVGNYFTLDESCMKFYSEFFDTELIEVINNTPCILQTKWKKLYDKVMDSVREWLAANKEETLKQYNASLFKVEWNKYASGNISSWEMESLCFYYHEHELANIDYGKYGIAKFSNLSATPVVDYYFTRGQRKIPIYKLNKIVGTVISKNDNKNVVTILTPDSVVNVKFTKEYYANYAKQISQINEDGSKSVMEKGWFKRGNKIMVLGYRRENEFVAKNYKSSGIHQLYKINVTNNGKDMELEHERYNAEE